MVTIISGNIEAWIGISAAHVYMFGEMVYDALIEAGLISGASQTNSDEATDNNGRRRTFSSFFSLISIFTKLKVKVSQLFTYLFHRLFWWLFWSKTNKRRVVIGHESVLEESRPEGRVEVQ